MKKIVSLVSLLAVFAMLLVGCADKSGKDFDQTQTCSFHAKVLEVSDGYLLVEPLADSSESRSANQIQVSLRDKTTSWSIPAVGDVVKIVYDGNIMETYPAQISKVYHIEINNTTVK